MSTWRPGTPSCARFAPESGIAMDARLLRYYNEELRYLREMGGEFAREFPKIASRLGMNESRSPTPMSSACSRAAPSSRRASSSSRTPSFRGCRSGCSSWSIRTCWHRCRRWRWCRSSRSAVTRTCSRRRACRATLNSWVRHSRVRIPAASSARRRSATHSAVHRVGRVLPESDRPRAVGLRIAGAPPLRRARASSPARSDAARQARGR